MTYITFDDDGSFNAFTSMKQDEQLSIASLTDSDKTACKVMFPKGSHEAGRLHYSFDDEHGVEPERMRASYSLYFDKSFQPSFNGKLPGFAGRYGEAGAGGQRANGTNGWSARGSFYPPDADGNIPIGNYVYHVDMDEWGTHAEWDVALEPGKWHVVDQYIELNTPGEYDGVLRGWVNQNLVYDSNEWCWRDTDKLKIKEWWGHFYHGGDEPSPRDMHLYVDNLYFDDKYLPE